MAGLQGEGKTTTTAKLAAKLKKKGNSPVLVGCDIYRPAAIEQLKRNGEKVDVPVFDMGTNHKPVEIAKKALEYAKENHHNIVFLDTAGRLHIDEDMMNELIEIKDNVNVDDIILVVDAMTGQDAVNVAETFNEKLDITGVILTKLDGDTRGGAALSVRAVTGKPILYVGMEEKSLIWSSFILTEWQAVYLVWEIFFHLLRKLKWIWTVRRPKNFLKRLQKPILILMISLSSLNSLRRWAV